jgi:hypothetical protein
LPKCREAGLYLRVVLGIAYEHPNATGWLLRRIEAGHDPEQVALAALDMACGALSAARGPLWLAEQLETIARGLES